MSSYTYGYGNTYGFGGSVALAQIIYNMDTFNVDTSGFTTIDNAGSAGSTSDAPMYASNHIFLDGSTQSVDYPIPHTLGSEEITNGDMSSATGWTVQTGWDIGVTTTGVATHTGTAGSDQWILQSVLTIGLIYKVTVDVVVTSGQVYLQVGTGATSLLITTSGSYELEGECLISSFAGLKVASGDSFEGTIDNVSYRQITNPNSFLTYFDTATKSHVTLGNSVDGGSSDELVDTANNATQWIPQGTNIVEQDGDAVKTTHVDNSNGSYILLNDSEGLNQDLVIGETYQIKYTAKSSEGTTKVRVYSLSLQNETVITTEYITYIFEFVAESTTSNNLGLNNMPVSSIAWVKDVSVRKILPISTTYTQTNSHSNTFTTTVALTDLDRSLLNLNPESIARLVDGEIVSELSFDLTDIEAFYLGNEGEVGGAFVQNVMVDLGSELYTGSMSSAVTITQTTITGGFNFVGNAPLADSGWIDFVTTSIEDVIELSFDAVVNSGEYTIDATGYPHIDNGSVPHTIVTGRNTLVLTGVINTINPLNVTIADQTSPTFDIDITNISIKQIAVAEIINYASTCRTNLDLTNYGASNLLYKQDATGRWLSMADANLIEFTGDNRYADTGFMPPSDSAWEIDFVMETKADQTYKMSGCFSSTSANRFMVGQTNVFGEGLHGTLGSILIGEYNTAVSDGLHHIRVEFDGLGNGNFVIDNTITYPYVNCGYIYSATERFFIGTTSRLGVVYQRPHTLPTGLFQYASKERTSTERDVDYAKAKLLYPTLP